MAPPEPSGLHVVTRAPLVHGPDHGPGNGKVLFAVHGAMDRATSFRRLWAHLPEWDVVAYDRRGYAGSLELPLSEDFAQQVTDFIEVVLGHLDPDHRDPDHRDPDHPGPDHPDPHHPGPDHPGPDHLGRDHLGRDHFAAGQSVGRKRVIALGHSFGGNVVLAATAAVPGLIDAAVVYEPPPMWLGEGLSHQTFLPSLPHGEMAEAFMRRVAGDRTWDRLPDATRRLRRSEGATLANDMAILRQPAPFDPSEISVPVIVGYGGRSSAQAVTWTRQLAERLARAELVEVAEADHGVHFGHPAALADLVLRASALASPPE